MPIVLEDQLLDHLADPDSVAYLYRERFTSNLINEADKEVVVVYEWAIQYLSTHGQPAPRQVLEYEFPDLRLEPPLAPVAHVVAKFRERHVRNEAQATIKKIARTASLDPIGTVDTAFKEFHRIKRESASRDIEIDSADWRTVLADYKQKVAEGWTNGITFGWPDIDTVLGGLRKGGLYYVIGRPKRYKSWFLLCSAVEAARAGHRVAFFSLEMTRKETFLRAMCLFSNVSFSKMQRGELWNDEYAKVEKAMDEIADRFVILRPGTGDRTVASILTYANERESEAIYIDQLKYLESTRQVPADLRHREIEYINEEMKNACDHIPWYVAAQFNREAANLDEMGDLAKIGLSDSIGQTADMILGLHQTKAMRDSGLIEFGTIESRSFEHAAWTMGVNLNRACEFKVIERKADS